ncbi:MAG: thiolase domain-containing protein [Anaerolineaceae bacterium]|nr:thiolase domain-containing protein [Anaerolineaceae bacterium]
MRETAILEIGQIPVADHWDKSLLEISGEPVLQIFEKTGLNNVDSVFFGNMLSGAVNNQLHLGSYLGDWLGARHTEGIHVESACSSGASAFRQALMAVASGDVDTAIAVSAEKMTDSPAEEITAELATAADSEYERDMGVTFTAMNAMLMRRYMNEYGWKRENFANFSVNAHANAVHNPNARFRKAISRETYLRAEMVNDPVSVMDAPPVVDGAAAVLIVPWDHVRGQLGVVRILGSGAATDTAALHSRKDPLWLSAVEKSAKQAYAQAGVSPQDIDLFEAHDAFTIISALSLEGCGFAERGKGPELAENGEIMLKGRIPISTRGGLKARGHPVGATGLYQIVEAVQQLQGVCGEGQVENAKIAMTQSIGGLGTNVITNIFSL